jgi:hypothetical protein
VTTKQIAVAIRRNPPEEGRTQEIGGQSNLRVALDGNGARFKRAFLAAFR